jgi:hypothetical protein
MAAIAITINGDSQNLGVNWALTCLGSSITPAPANPCGTIAPAYVGATNGLFMTYTAPVNIPVGNTVTLTAQLTSNPAISESVTLTIAPLPITIAITQLPPPTLGVNGKGVLVALVSNDATAAGVMWSLTCASADCGSLQSGLPVATETASSGQITYIAPVTIPSGGTVKITATSIADPTKSASTTVTVAAISISVSPTAANVPVIESQTLTATVVYDAANAGVDWSIQPCGTPGQCGTITPTHTMSGEQVTYTAPNAIPAGGTVTLVASSTTNPATRATSVLTIIPPPPVQVSVTPQQAIAQASQFGSVEFVSMLQYAYTNPNVTWSLSCGSTMPGACGSIAPGPFMAGTDTYGAPPAVPPGGTVTVTVTSVEMPSSTASATVTIVPPISIALVAAPTAATAGTGVTFSATVTNELSPGGVDWTATCSSPPCGTFNPAHTANNNSTVFTPTLVQPAGTVTVTATSTASETIPPMASVSSPVTITPVVQVNFLPFPPSQLQVSNQQPLGTVLSAPINLQAVVLNDNTNAGIDWSLCSTAATCGMFQVTPAMAATATSPNPVNPVYSQTLHTASGQMVSYIPPAQPPTSGTVTVTAKATTPAATTAAGTANATIQIVNTPVGVGFSGTVVAGTAPVSGATVTLYEAGTTGYGSLASPVTLSGGGSTVKTNSSGSFSIPAGYLCTSQTSQLYLVATGGDAGAGVNPNLALMTAIGPCQGINANANIVINEVTTIASVWPLAPFTTDALDIGASSSNAVGIANAFNTVNNLVKITTGKALAATPVGNSTVPLAEINTLANLLNTCTASSGGAVGDGSACGALFAVANPSPLNATAPTNTLQAAINIAQSPNTEPNNPDLGASLFALLPATFPFSPVLQQSPNDWTLALGFTGGGLNSFSSASAFAIDASGNVWTANSRFGRLTELNALGAPLSPPSTGTGRTAATAGGFSGGGLSNPSQIAIDPLGNVWVANSASLSQFSPLGTPISPSSGYTGGGLGSPVSGLAIDGTGNLWTISASSSFLSWFAGANYALNNVPQTPGSPLTLPSGDPSDFVTPSGALAIDTSGTVWELDGGSLTAGEFNSVNGSFIQADAGYVSTVPQPGASVISSVGVSPSIVIDNAGDVFYTAQGQLVELLSGGNSTNDGGLGKFGAALGDTVSSYLALDGASRLWVQIGTRNCVSNDSVVALNFSGNPVNTDIRGCGYLGNGIGALNRALAVDASGNLWILSSGSVSELIGVAAPVVTPFSVGVQNRTLGKKP